MRTLAWRYAVPYFHGVCRLVQLSVFNRNQGQVAGRDREYLAVAARSYQLVRLAHGLIKVGLGEGLIPQREVPPFSGIVAEAMAFNNAA